MRYLLTNPIKRMMERRIKVKRVIIYLLFISVFLLLSLPTVASDDNEISISQTGGGNSATFRINQYGYDNLFNLSINSWS